MDVAPARMDEVEARAWLALIGTSELLPTALDAQLQADAGMTHFEYLLLGLLGVADEHTMRMKQLAEGANSTLPRLSKAVNRLEGRGWVERIDCLEDRRATNVRLTQAGRRAMILATPAHLDTVRRAVLDRLSREQLRAIAEALEPIVAGLDPNRRFLRTAD